MILLRLAYRGNRSSLKMKQVDLGQIAKAQREELGKEVAELNTDAERLADEAQKLTGDLPF